MLSKLRGSIYRNVGARWGEWGSREVLHVEIYKGSGDSGERLDKEEFKLGPHPIRS